MSDSPARRYARSLEEQGFQPDLAQARAVDALERIHGELLSGAPRRRGFGFGRRQWTPVKGLYLWGGVGRGKTWLMDAFFDSLPFEARQRTHFHRFMLQVHAARKRYLEEQDPVALIAEAIARDTRVLCFDEFFVSDIADAMILGRLTEVLFREGVTLVATSNVAPDDLYRNGLQRERFLPAIARIKQQCQIMHLDSPTDFRLRTLTRVQLYHDTGLAAEPELAKWFDELSGQPREPDAVIEILGRPVRSRRLSDSVAWFDFAELCETARAASDYIELARSFHTVLISRIPQLDSTREDAARRFIHLVDEFYDRGVKLILAADVPRDQLYAGKRLAFEFERAQSRLTEMQSREYLARPHLA
jgi:cell division protein ZapE